MFFYPSVAITPSSRPFEALRDVLREIATGLRAARARRAEAARVRRELASYSDRELADLGISRSDIDAIAREAA